jgi:Uma2 family endonuclease
MLIDDFATRQSAPPRSYDCGSQPGETAMAITDQTMSLEEFLELPEEKPALEYWGGRITQKVPPKGRHSVLQAACVELFNRFGRPNKYARAFPELRSTYGAASLVPDVSVYRWDRIPRDEVGRIADDFWEPPDIAVEIVSPSQSVNALIRKCLWFVEQGTQIAILVDPADESVLLFHPGKQPKVLGEADSIDLTSVLPEFRVTVRELFDSLLD